MKKCTRRREPKATEPASLQWCAVTRRCQQRVAANLRSDPTAYEDGLTAGAQLGSTPRTHQSSNSERFLVAVVVVEHLRVDQPAVSTRFVT
jgi:hypothetical protein